MTDDMFFTQDAKALRRGRRAARRTATCRPCLVWPADAPEIQVQGVILDANPYGMLIRMLEPMPLGTEVRVQLMRDDRFEQPLSAPVEGHIVRHSAAEGLFVDHGVRLLQKENRPSASKVVSSPLYRPAAPRARTRMHTLDLTIGDKGVRQTRNR